MTGRVVLSRPLRDQWRGRKTSESGHPCPELGDCGDWEAGREERGVRRAGGRLQEPCPVNSDAGSSQCRSHELSPPRLSGVGFVPFCLHLLKRGFNASSTGLLTSLRPRR